jgi:hypothetical protein
VTGAAAGRGGLPRAFGRLTTRWTDAVPVAEVACGGERFRVTLACYRNVGGLFGWWEATVERAHGDGWARVATVRGENQGEALGMGLGVVGRRLGGNWWPGLEDREDWEATPRKRAPRGMGGR